MCIYSLSKVITGQKELIEGKTPWNNVLSECGVETSEALTIKL